MPQWLLLILTALALLTAGFALLRANRVDAAMRQALATLPAAAGEGAAPDAASSPTVTLPDAQGPLSRVAIIRFDAFADISGKLSSAAALLDEHGNGLVITTMNGRENSRNYIKHVRQGIGVAALSPEEHDAVAKAMNSARRPA